MHDIRAIRENPAAFDAAMGRLGIDDAYRDFLRAVLRLRLLNSVSQGFQSLEVRFQQTGRQYESLE